MGIDRMAMFLTDNYSIREVMTFPFMKEEKERQKGKVAAEVAGVEAEEGVAEDVPLGKK